MNCSATILLVSPPIASSLYFLCRVPPWNYCLGLRLAQPEREGLLQSQTDRSGIIISCTLKIAVLPHFVLSIPLLSLSMLPLADVER